ncbi:hypothetical protein L916_21301 [Phytophthora nicotianae]|uniref:Uncharacterized protein n=1 Tax=Phytophthora nicotianae TaxID=4792 RepID=W2HSD1_PHYNI|nr:hypothetical protein L916_21301 [Phytophthora nicotianae]
MVRISFSFDDDENLMQLATRSAAGCHLLVPSAHSFLAIAEDSASKYV